MTASTSANGACPPASLVQAAGRDTTGGAFDAPAYFWAISPAAQGPTHMEACYRHQA